MADGYISEIKLPDNKTYLIKDSEKSDTKVVQTLTSTSAEYKILFTTTASPTSGNAYEAYYGANFTYNPSTKALSTGGTINGYTLAAACAKSVTDSSNASAISTGTSLPTERDIYYGLPTINGVHTYDYNTNYYIPTNIGTQGQVLKSTGTGEPSWSNEYKIEILRWT